MVPVPLNKIYRALLKYHGKQYWWPGDTEFEIMIGAILTQSISWKNVETAIEKLKQNNLLSPEALYSKKWDVIAPLIKSTGYFNQKAKKIKNFLEWFKGYDFSLDLLKQIDTALIRSELLAINGIGEETSDSILLYALSRKIFVIDAYTRRIFKRIGILTGSEKYSKIQEIFHKRFNGLLQDYNEFHALIVIHGKNICKKNPVCIECCISDLCRKNI